VTRNRRIVLGCAGVVAAWVVGSLVLGSLDGPCNADSLSGCGAYGEIVFWTMMIVLPIVFFWLVALLVFGLIGSHGRKRQDSDPRG
jgi:hypothetical protein